MQKKNISIIEGLIFLSGDEGLTLLQIVSCMNHEVSKEEALQIIEFLQEEKKKENSGIQLVRFGELYKFVSKEEVHPYAMRLFQTTAKITLSPAALETLSIIAYKQPITRVEIEEIRGVNCDAMIRKLLARNLIQEKGRSEALGKPFLYEVTQEFLDRFQLKDLTELPELPKYREEEQQTLFED